MLKTKILERIQYLLKVKNFGQGIGNPGKGIRTMVKIVNSSVRDVKVQTMMAIIKTLCIIG